MNLDPSTSLAIMNATTPDMAAAKAKAKAAALHNQSTGNSTIDEKSMARIEETAKEFEAMFMSQMLKPMFEGIKPNAMFGGGKGEEIFNGFMIEEYGKMMAETGDLGIADSVKAELIKMQENIVQ